MKMNRLSSLCLAATLSLFTACAAGEYAYNEWDNDSSADLDDNDLIEENEYDTWYDDDFGV